MSVSRLALLLGCVPATAWRASRSPLLCHSLRKMSSQGEKSKPVKQSLKKPKLPEGRFDAPEDSNLEKEPLTKFPDDINPDTKEKGGPRGPEPTRYGDWERKGRCIDF
ncbi:succinate dehydrogenase assembly factor 4, mitochondrial isoform X2 [Ursus maritimus]|uniref:Succinate dehydrogenase assembly factor 4, mitochondrial n=2 Tax=Ursus TaxID=9639 RepID=A0A384BL81_URSMA|nr:succinate dehydrogenase assembly factor 4, mitochondrial isoform X2 [Ursus maritimus]XP_008683045.1 succinate dehydrogenase assembly factor 4, mitochondrial isoform X2 [Ursus maritimus]